MVFARNSAAFAPMVLSLALGCSALNPAFNGSVVEADADQGSGATAGTSMTEGGGGADNAAREDAAPLPADASAIEGVIDASMDRASPNTRDAGVASACPTGAPAGWVCIPPGSFNMGSPDNEQGRGSDETVHPVTITHAFWMQITEVTQKEWQAAMGNNPSKDQACGETCPVEQVTWYAAIAFANALSLRDGYTPCYEKSAGGIYDAAAGARATSARWTVGLACSGYRLPTEAEWEYAARAGSATAFPSGPITGGLECAPADPALAAVAWYCGDGSKLQPAGGKQANAWGLHDMHGSVWEWVWDQEGPSGADYPAGTAVDPLGATSGSDRRDRGGSFHDDLSLCRSAARDAVSPDKPLDDTGLRLVRSAL